MCLHEFKTCLYNYFFVYSDDICVHLEIFSCRLWDFALTFCDRNRRGGGRLDVDPDRVGHPATADVNAAGAEDYDTAVVGHQRDGHHGGGGGEVDASLADDSRVARLRGRLYGRVLVRNYSRYHPEMMQVLTR